MEALNPLDSITGVIESGGGFIDSLRAEKLQQQSGDNTILYVMAAIILTVLFAAIIVAFKK